MHTIISLSAWLGVFIAILVVASLLTGESPDCECDGECDNCYGMKYRGERLAIPRNRPTSIGGERRRYRKYDRQIRRLGREYRRHVRRVRRIEGR